MATDDKTLLISAQVDSASVRKAEKAAQDVAKSLDRVSASTKNTGDAMSALERQRAISKIAVDAGKLAAQIGDVGVASNRMKRELSGIKPELTGPEYADAAIQMERAATETSRWRDEIEGVRKELNAAADAADDIKTPGGRTGKAPSLRAEVGALGDVDTSFATFRGAADFAGLGGGGLEVVSELFAVTEAVGQLKQAAGEAPKAIGALVSSLGTTGIGLIAVVGAAAIAIKIAGDEVAKARQAFEGASEVQQRVFRESAELTTEEARARLEEAEQRRDATKALLDQRQELIRLADAAQNTDPLMSAATVLFDVFHEIPTETLAKEIRELNKDLNESENEITQYSNAIQSGAFAAQDAAEVERQLADERRRATAEYLADFQARVNEEARYADLLATGTSEATQALIEADERRLAVIDRMLPELLALNDGSEEYQNAIDALLKEQDLLVSSTQRLTEITAQLSEAERNAAFAEGVISTISDITGSFGALLTGGGELVSAISDYTTSIEVDTSKLADIAKKYSDAIANAETTANNARAAADSAAQEAREKAGESYKESVVKLEEDTARKRLDINRKANRTINDAVANRDALAAYQAERARKDELRKLNDDTARQQETLQKGYDKQLKTIDANLQKQNDAISKRYAEQVASARKAAQEATAIEQQRINEAIAKARAEQQERLLAQTQGIAQRVAAETQGAAQVVSVVGSMFDNILQLGRNAAAALPATGTTNAGTSTTSPPIMRPPSVPTAPKPGSGRTSGDSITVNFAGATTGTIQATSKQQAIDVLVQQLDRMGAR